MGRRYWKLLPLRSLQSLNGYVLLFRYVLSLPLGETSTSIDFEERVRMEELLKELLEAKRNAATREGNLTAEELPGVGSLLSPLQCELPSFDPGPSRIFPRFRSTWEEKLSQLVSRNLSSRNILATCLLFAVQFMAIHTSQINSKQVCVQ